MALATPTTDCVYDYAGYHGCPSRCRLRIFHRGPDRPLVVLVSELLDNPGTSITNRAEALASQVALEYGIDHDTMYWIEHYPASSLRETFKLVQFQPGAGPGELIRPCWTLVTRAWVERLAGGPLVG